LADEIRVSASWADVIFGPAHTEPPLGAMVLDSAGVAVDPLKCCLKRLPALPLKQ
jgi:hypothetical protein